MLQDAFFGGAEFQVELEDSGLELNLEALNERLAQVLQFFKLHDGVFNVEEGLGNEEVVVGVGGQAEFVID